MFQNRKFMRLLICLIISTLIIESLSDLRVFANNDKDDTVYVHGFLEEAPYVVSMGDSFSSGEGIPDFYGSRNTSDPNFYDWLAHRSQYSWPGQLEVPGLGVLKDNKDGDDPHWFFVAASGATTWDIYGEQHKGFQQENGIYIPSFDLRNKKDDEVKLLKVYKEYLNNEGAFTENKLPKQIQILDDLRNMDIVPEYITLTMGGNDLGFQDVITSAAISLTFLNPTSMYSRLTEATIKLDYTDDTDDKRSVRQRLEEVYINIYNAASIGDKHPYIIVAGYPHLLNDTPDRMGANPGDSMTNACIFDYEEAKMVNNRIDYFDDALAAIVNKCKREYNMQIEYVDVREAFKDHKAYSKNPWINGVLTPPCEQDLYPDFNIDFSFMGSAASLLSVIHSPVNLISAYSIHPTKEGAIAYADCVQKAINKIESLRTHDSEKDGDVVVTEDTLTDPISGKKTISFGQYNGEDVEWLVLDENEEGMFLLSEKILDAKEFNSMVYDLTWEESGLRKWLNEDFYNSTFDSNEKNHILKTHVKTNDNPEVFYAKGGNETDDYLFLLSFDELDEYFSKKEEIKAKPTQYAIENGANPAKNNCCFWWLRTRGCDNFRDASAGFMFVNHEGEYELYEGLSVYTTLGIRPAMWVDFKYDELSKINTKYTEDTDKDNDKDKDIDNDKDKDNDKEVDKEDEKKNEQKDNEKQENEKKDTEKTKKGKEGWIIENDYKNGKNLFPDSYMNNIDIRVYDSHAYLIYALDYTWEDAKEYCEKLGGHLVTITDDDEQKAVYSYVKSNAPDTDLWIGCSDIQKEGTWKWVTDEKFEYNNFAKGQGAKCSAPAVQDYGAICNGKRSGTVGGVNYSIAAGEWDDLNNGDHTQKGYFICEWDDYSSLKKLIGVDSLKIKKSPENKSEGFRLTSKGVFVMDTTLFGCTPAEVEKKIGYDIPDTLEWEFDGPDLKVSWLDGYRGFNIGLFFQNGKLKWCAYSPEGLYWDDKLWQNAQSVYGKGYMDDDNDGHIWIGKNKYRILAYSYNTDSGEKRDVLRQSVYASDFVKN